MNLQELSFISRTLLSSQPSIAYTWGDRPRLVSPTRLFLRDFASSGPGLSPACLSWPGPALLALAVVCKVFAPHRGQSPGSRDSQPELLPFFIEDKTWRDLSREIHTGFENFFALLPNMWKRNSLIAYSLNMRESDPTETGSWVSPIQASARQRVGKKCASVESAIRIRFCKHTERASFNLMNHIYVMWFQLNHVNLTSNQKSVGESIEFFGWHKN